MPKLLKEISSASIYISQESVSDPFIIISHLADSLEGMSLLGRNPASLQAIRSHPSRGSSHSLTPNRDTSNINSESDVF